MGKEGNQMAMSWTIRLESLTTIENETTLERFGNQVDIQEIEEIAQQLLKSEEFQRASMTTTLLLTLYLEPNRN